MNKMTAAKAMQAFFEYEFITGKFIFKIYSLLN